MSKLEAAISLKKLFEQYAKRLLTNKVRPSISEEGIMTIPNNKRVEKMAQSLYEDFKQAGVPDNILQTENDIKVFHHKIAEINNENIAKQFDTLMDESSLFNPKKEATVFDLKGNKIKNPQNIMGGEEIIETEAEILARLNKGNKKGIDSLKKKLDEPDDMATGGRAGYVEGGRIPFGDGLSVDPERDSFKKISNVIGAYNRYRRGEKNPALNFNQFFELFSAENFATGGRAGYYMGGQAMVGEDLSDVGHGSDSLMARNMQLSPGSQATTSTGLNYLLGQDNDTVRVPYNKGKLAKKAVDEGRRGFMKAAGAAGAGIAALKTGLLGFADKAAPVVEKVAEAAGEVPTHFLKLVEKITKLGEDITQFGALSERQTVKKFKDFEMTTDTATGEIQIFKNSQSDEAIDRFASQNANEEVFMRYKPGKGQIDETTKGKTPLDEYEENTSYISNNRENTGEILEEVSGVPDDIFLEVGEAIPEAIRKGQADGGRMGYSKGDIVTKGIPALIKAGEGKFTKAQYLIERIKNTIKGSPDDKYVQDTFPGFIDELTVNPDLAKNENVFKELGGDLPEGQQIVVYGDDTLDFFTTSSGPKNIKKLDQFMAKHNLSRERALEIMKMEPNDQVMELTKTKFLKQKQTDN